MKTFDPLSSYSPTHWRSEGDINTTAARRDWLTHVNDETTQNLLQRDANVFLHQAMSTPCLAPLPVQRAAICMMYQGKVISIFMAIMCINSVMVIRR